MGFHQATWEEPLLIERSQKPKIAYAPILPTSHETSTIGAPLGKIPKRLVREADAPLPELSEPEVIRHFTRLSQENYTPDVGIYPLGSCTMKYNPKICDVVVQNHKLEKVHPEQDESTVQGILGILYKLERILCEVTGMSRMSLQPAAGAHGEFLGALIIRAYHRARGEADQRSEML